MQFIHSAEFTADHAWGAREITAITDATVRLHWTDQPYIWHVNDGPEVFVVLDGAVDMHHLTNGHETVTRLVPGQICFAEIGDEHVAHPCGEARILVIEKSGSV